MKKAVRVWVSGSTSNLGPGFDTLGIAFRLYNRVTVRLASDRKIHFDGGAKNAKARETIAMAREAADSFFQRTGLEPPGFHFKIEGEVPCSRGLGSSVTLYLGVAAGLNELLGGGLKREDLFEMISRIEGHPDNVAPSVYGGLTVAGKIGDRFRFFRLKLPSRLKFVAAIPDLEVSTVKSRWRLPSTVSFSDAVHNLNRVGLLVSAFWSGQFEEAEGCFEDRLHQPQRSRRQPQLYPALNAAKLAGAIGGWLSGSGSIVMAMTLKNPEKIGIAMQAVFRKDGIRCKVRVLEADNRGFFCERG